MTSRGRYSKRVLYAQVVNLHVEQGNGLESAIRVTEVQLRHPVVGLIGFRQRVRASGRLKDVLRHGQVEVAATHDHVGVASRHARTDDGVCTAGKEGASAIEVVDCEGARSFCR